MFQINEYYPIDITQIIVMIESETDIIILNYMFGLDLTFRFIGHNYCFNLNSIISDADLMRLNNQYVVMETSRLVSDMVSDNTNFEQLINRLDYTKSTVGLKLNNDVSRLV